MAVLMSLGGNSAGDGFLLAPLGSNYEAEIALRTDAGTANVTLQASPNPANLVFSNAGPIPLTTTPTIVTVHALSQSGSRRDTTIQVLDSATMAVLTSFTVTCIKHPVINFGGRFEARFATDMSFTNLNPMYTAANDNVVPTDFSAGWTWGLEGEPNFVPTIGNVPTSITTTGVGRVIRLNNPVSLRPLGGGTVPAVTSTVVSITGETTGGTETFTTGDPLIGQSVNFGPDTYFAGNAGVNSMGTAGMPGAEEFWSAGKEPLGLFEIRFGASFSPPALFFRGASQVGPPGSGMIGLDKHTRNPDSRPIANGLFSATTEFNEAGLPTNVNVFSDARIDALILDYDALPPGASAARRNLVRRIGHLLGSASPAKVTALNTSHPGVFTTRISTVAWGLKEVYSGTVDTDLHAWPGGPPGASSVITYLTEFFGFGVQWVPIAFHSDELCGYHKGTFKPNLGMHGGHIGDPHCHTVDGTAYDFQAVGEFTLLRDGERMEVQVRQTPVAAANPAPDSHTGLTACVSINTAVAARVGKHRISLQPGREGKQLQFYLDRKPTQIPTEGIDLDGNHVSAFDANGETGLRIDYADGTVVTATPTFWNAHQVWYIDVSVSNTGADEGVMGFIPKDSWLPRLRNGKSLGPMPAGQHARYLALYKTFANSWRVTKATSLFTYAPGTSTATFTDRDWPAEQAPCNLKPQFQIPGVGVLQGMPVQEAERICRFVADKELQANCVFDVATTGDEIFAVGYRQAQDLKFSGTSVKIEGDQPWALQDRLPFPLPGTERSRPENSLLCTATVSTLTPDRPTPTGTVTFSVDGIAMKRPVELDSRGRAQILLTPLKPGEHRIRATYTGGGQFGYHSSSSPNMLYTVGNE